MDLVSQIMEKSTLNSKYFAPLLQQGSLKCESNKLYYGVRKCEISIDTYDDAISILQSYKKFFKLKSSGNLADFFKKYSEEHGTDSSEVIQLKEEIEDLKSKLTLLEKSNNHYKTAITDYKEAIDKYKEALNQSTAASDHYKAAMEQYKSVGETYKSAADSYQSTVELYQKAISELKEENARLKRKINSNE
ncbi:hypothetical protein TVAG_360430 [Trichomonas vaginalis G3]|uniref:Uncharacterized protein n=1 Tax=Trichomonas vaginalis (strain ATCC PRA-98 / G3) TaxID=412133 RepID=A2FX83_TRIV3|nr:protein ubiquitination [Trichomonas vaginalis G3]EAX90496.1 hypothetical protein TVAG_360430 [Trichomonas vaginalis G3]KAI5538666.1 protein ubiquitination [Trichomonas vaginalis G3]|eukprot:XP_001303426.1 hypothetical protein [Trichomonas vaginalis G3]